jgi:Pvc16 N-terminal domain
VIESLDDALEQLLVEHLPPPITKATQISFEPPDASFPPSAVVLPAIDLFLYDVRQNYDRRANDWVYERPAEGDIVKVPPPLRVDCSYLITAWGSNSSSSRMRDEHRLLGEVLKVIVAFPTMPEALMPDQAFPPPVLALGPGRLSSVSDFWHALGGKPKAALELTVTIAVEASAAVDAGPPVRERAFNLTQRGVSG